MEDGSGRVDSGRQNGAYEAHRIASLADGVFAVAMTLLVIDLKLPSTENLDSSAALGTALAVLAPRAFAWVLSFFVLALYWHGHSRAFHYVRHPSGRLTALSLLQLALVSLMPFSSALIGEHSQLWLAQLVYSLNMALLAFAALLTSRHIFRHPDSMAQAMSLATYRGARLRTGALVLISLLAVGVGALLPGAGNMMFMLMGVVIPVSRRLEARALRQ
jgi:uncharacterized membrane protein